MSESGPSSGTWATGDLSPTAVWACRSAFCMRRGPFWVRSLKHAQADAGKHAARRFLGLFPHDTVVGPRRERPGDADHGSARVPQRGRDRGADPARRPGHEREPARERAHRSL